MIHLDPRELPEVRAQIVGKYGSGDIVIEVPDHGWVDPETFRRAELFFVTAPMCELTYRAAQSLETFPMEPSDLIAPDALLYFESPIGPFATSGIHLVSLSAQESGVAGVLFLDRATMEALREETLRADEGTLPWTRDQMEIVTSTAATRFGVFSSFHIPWGQPIVDKDLLGYGRIPSADLFGARIATALLLMGQTLVESHTTHAPRAAQRRMIRDSMPTTPVRIINLRSPSGQSGDATSQRAWAHQWIVRGHWRQQWYPSIQDHRPVWIAPHRKGPEDAPMLGGEKVYQWSR